MFIRYTYVFDGYHKLQTTHYKIIDSDFEQIFDSGRNANFPNRYGGIEVATGVIDVYESKGLLVARNLVRFFLYYNDVSAHGEIDYQIRWNKEHNAKFAKYESDVMKLLVLL